jgi:hypothetical protein
MLRVWSLAKNVNFEVFPSLLRFDISCSIFKTNIENQLILALVGASPWDQRSWMQCGVGAAVLGGDFERFGEYNPLDFRQMGYCPAQIHCITNVGNACIN